ncbi:MAG: DUF5004 domain-containing protein [Bacteroidia bacterium]
MNKITYTLVAFCLLVAFTSCKKNKDSISIDKIVNTWVKDDEHKTGNKDTQFFKERKDVSIRFRKDKTYTYTYTLISNSTKTEENGAWSYNEDAKLLSLAPQGGTPYTYGVSKLTEEEFRFTASAISYDNEGKPVRTDEIVSMEDDD